LGDAQRQERYRLFLRATIPEGEWNLIRDAVQRGQLTGTGRFVDKVEEVLGRRIEKRTRGRPPKTERTTDVQEKLICPGFVQSRIRSGKINLSRIIVGINTGPQNGHHNHFHVDVRRPDRVALPSNLLADEAVLSQTQTAADADLLAAAQALLEQMQPTLNFEQGDVTMFVMDMPPDVPPQYAPVVIAQASQAKDPAKTERTIGVCALVENPIEVFDELSGLKGQYSAVNNIAPEAVVSNYLMGFDRKRFASVPTTVTVLKGPAHGTLELRKDEGRFYIPEPNYFGPDRATFLVERAGMKIKVEYFIKVMETVPGGTEGYDPYWDEELCPNGSRWEISLNDSDPNAPIYTFEHPYPFTSALAGYTRTDLRVRSCTITSTSVAFKSN
jgi:hypothetical protein